MTDILIIFYWPDGCWTTADEYSEAEYGFKGDDFGILSMPIDASDADIELEIADRIH